MARTDNLTNYLADIATAIKEKRGESSPIKASEFDAEIVNLPSGGGDENAVVKDNFTASTASGSNQIANLITKIKPFDTSGRTNFSYMFGQLVNLEEVPQIDTSNATRTDSMFYRCTKIKNVPNLDVSKSTNASYMFFNCNELEAVPDLYMPLCTNLLSIFSGCKKLTKIGEITVGKNTTMRTVFSSCEKLENFPYIDTSFVNNWNSTFVSCKSMIELPAYDFTMAQDINRMCQNCTSLETVPRINLQSANIIWGMFTGCSNLKNLGGFVDLGKAFSSSAVENNNDYTLTLNASTQITEESMINVLNNLFDIASIGVKPQQCIFGSTNLKKLTSDAGKQALANAQAKGWTVS